MPNRKKISIFLTALLVTMVVSGCSTNNDRDYYNNYDSDRVTTLFLVDEQGFTYGGIPYKCDSMTRWRKTKSNGEFTFIQPDRCTFDFNGLDGVYGDSYDDVVRIVDYAYSGKGDIPYDCKDFGASSTYSDGSFSYNSDDECTFQL